MFWNVLFQLTPPLSTSLPTPAPHFIYPSQPISVQVLKEPPAHITPAPAALSPTPTLRVAGRGPSHSCSRSRSPQSLCTRQSTSQVSHQLSMQDSGPSVVPGSSGFSVLGTRASGRAFGVPSCVPEHFCRLQNSQRTRGSVVKHQGPLSASGFRQ